METNFEHIRKTEHLLMLLKRMISIVETEHSYKDISNYDNLVEQQFLLI